MDIVADDILDWHCKSWSTAANAQGPFVTDTRRKLTDIIAMMLLHSLLHPTPFPGPQTLPLRLFSEQSPPPAFPLAPSHSAH